MRFVVILPLLVSAALAMPVGAAAQTARDWSAATPAGTLSATLEGRGKASTLVLTLRPAAGLRVVPPALRVDVPALLRSRVGGRFPAVVRSDREEGPLRAVLPLKGPLRIADPDRNDGMMRVEFRYCRGPAAHRPDRQPDRQPDQGLSACAVERLDIPLRAGS